VLSHPLLQGFGGKDPSVLALCLPPPQGQLLRAVGEQALNLERLVSVDWNLDL